jgi:SAM-dependent methyltransferase
MTQSTQGTGEPIRHKILVPIPKELGLTDEDIETLKNQLERTYSALSTWLQWPLVSGDHRAGDGGGGAPGGLGREMTRFEHVERLAACDVCGSERLREVDARAHVVECAECGHRFVSPRPTQAAIAAAYSDPHAYDHWLREEEGRRRMWRKRLDLLERQPAPGRRLLDVGAGIGTFLALAAERGWQVAGTEISESAVRLARERHGLELRPAQLEEAGFEADSFDVITLWHVLEHVPSPRRTLLECHRLLVPGGLLVAATPNDSAAMVLPRRAKRLLQRLPYRRYEELLPGEEVHLSHFRPETLRRLLRATGFQPLQVGVDDQYPRPNLLTDARVVASRALAGAGLNLGNSLLAIARWIPLPAALTSREC